jgi:hypothetical protein
LIEVSDEEPYSSGSDSDEDVVIQSDHETDSEQDVSMSETTSNSSDDSGDENEVYLGRDKVTQWKQVPVRASGRRRLHNILTEQNGLRGNTLQATTILEFWKCFITDDMIEDIVRHTNKKIASVRPNYIRDRDAKDTDKIELLALFGLLYLAGRHRASRMNLRDFWSTDGTGSEVFRTTMAYKRAQFLLQTIRFDDIETRVNRRATDKLAGIRSVFEHFVENCKANYIASENVTIDETLVGFRGRAPFRQYIPSKPSKYGIKIFALCDAETFYTLNLEIYAGKQPDGPFAVSNSPHDVVLRLITPIENTGRNLTVDNWFSSVYLLRKLLEKKITMVSTIRKNKREIPTEFVDVKNRELYSTKAGYQQDAMLLSYKAKKKK